MTEKSQSESDKTSSSDKDIELYDPSAEHFVSRNKRSEFQNWLEEGQFVPGTEH